MHIIARELHCETESMNLMPNLVAIANLKTTLHAYAWHNKSGS